MSKEKVKSEKLEAATQAMKAMAQEIHTVFTPQWNSRTELLKTLITLSSGSIVIINTFSSSFRTVRTVGAVWWWLVLVSFILLVLALATAFTALWIGAAVYGLQSDIYTLTHEMKEALEAAASHQDFVKVFEDLTNKRFDPAVRADTRARWLLTSSSICFCTAILLLAAIGIRQFTL